MKRLIVSMADYDAVEVRENCRLAPQMGMSQLAYRELIVKEREIVRKCAEILKKSEFPVLVQKLIAFGAFPEEKKRELRGFFAVLKKSVTLMTAGFHAVVVTAMLGCTRGKGDFPYYNREFDAKFIEVFKNKEVCKDFWGTADLLPMNLVRKLLIDFMNGIDPDCLSEHNLMKSELVRCCFLVGKKLQAQKLEAFIAFCKA